VGSGTLAYMAPELMDGGPASVGGAQRLPQRR
jgi:hypothetical protein